jgi:hypothetical protein
MGQCVVPSLDYKTNLTPTKPTTGSYAYIQEQQLRSVGTTDFGPVGTGTLRVINNPPELESWYSLNQSNGFDERLTQRIQSMDANGRISNLTKIT